MKARKAGVAIGGVDWPAVDVVCGFEIGRVGGEDIDGEICDAREI